jgi:glycosyltransferase involved in cell wall biosynthesis
MTETQPTFSTLSVLVPVYNESRTLETISERILAAPVELDLEVVMVDDGSSDESWVIMEHLAASDDRIKIVKHPHNRGKGAAIRTAIDSMTGDIAIVQDADLEYDPAEFGKVIGPILSGHADAVFGSRFASSPVRRVLFYWHSLGNKFLTWLFNIFNDLNLTDMETCYKAVRTDVLRELRLQSDRFGIEPEISTRLAQWGARIYEVPVSYHGRTYAEGKHIGWRDGLQALWLIVKYRFFDTEYSRTGEGTEVSLGNAKRYASWVLERMAPDLGTSVIELDAGMGSYTRLLLKSPHLTVVESNPRLVGALRRRYGRSPHVAIVEGDPSRGLTVEASHHVALSFNGLSTSDDPGAWLKGAAETLEPGGRLQLLVPAHEELASPVDDAMLNRRRFSADELAALLADAGFEVEGVEEFNRLGALGWQVSGALGFTRVGSWQAALFSLVVPLAKRVDGLLGSRGLSLLASAHLK